MSWYYTSKYTDFENKTAEIDVEALMQNFLIRISPAIRRVQDTYSFRCTYVYYHKLSLYYVTTSLRLIYTIDIHN